MVLRLGPVFLPLFGQDLAIARLAKYTRMCDRIVLQSDSPLYTERDTPIKHEKYLLQRSVVYKTLPAAWTCRVPRDTVVPIMVLEKVLGCEPDVTSFAGIWLEK